MLTVNSVSLSDARRIIEAGEAKASELGQPSNIPVVDQGGVLVADLRVDVARRGTVDIAINRTYTAGPENKTKRWPMPPPQHSDPRPSIN